MSADTDRAWSLVVLGAPRTKKTHSQIVLVRRRGLPAQRKVVPSAAWTRWVRGAVIRVGLTADHRLPHPRLVPAPNGRGYVLLEDLAPSGVWVPIGCRVNCRALFYRHANVGDAVGFYQGLADLLQQRGVIEDDKLIVSWDGTRLLRDGEQARVEVRLEEV